MRLRHLLRERDVRGRVAEQVLSVYRDLGVVPKAGRSDNFNKTPEDLSNYKLVQPGDVVVNKMKAWQGSIAVSGHRGIVSGDYLVCEVVRPVDQRFLHHALRSRPMVGEYLVRSKGIRPSQWRLYWDDLGDIQLHIPQPDHQRSIADFLDAETVRIDALIAKKRRLIELLDERFEARVFHCITSGLRAGVQTRPNGLTWVREIPEAWGTPTVSANFELQLGKMLNAEAASGPNQYPYLRNVNVQWDRTELSDLATMQFDESDRRRCELRQGDVLVCEGGEVGRAAVWDGSIDHCYFQKAIHRVRPRGGSNGRYLMYCLRAAAKRSVFTVEGNLSTIVHLTGEQLRVHRFPWPPADEQAAIVKHLDESAGRLHETRSKVSRQIELLIERRQALITAAVTGELEIPGVAA